MSFFKFLRTHIVEVLLGTGALVAISAVAYNQLYKKMKKLTRIIDTIEACNKPTVHMKNPNHVEDILSMLIKGGAGRLQVIADFDHTLSRVHLNGIGCLTSFGLLESGPHAPAECKQKAKELFDHYYPIEMDPYLSPQEKEPYVKEWYSKSLKLLSSFGMSKSQIEDMVAVSGTLLRDGCDILFRSLYSRDVPFLVFSAGVGDVLKEVIRFQNLLYPNVKIISNFLEFDKMDNIVGFKGNLIHTFNKNLIAAENKDYFDHLKDRHNVVLLGDSLSDLDMAEGVKHLNCILKIGFLNSKVQERLPKYLDAYDIVLTDDQTMDVVNSLLHHII